MNFLTIIELKFDDPVIERLKKHSIIDEVTGCWLWQGAGVPKGYGIIRYRSRNVYVHRLSAFLYFMTDINDRKIHVCHREICPNPNCWNPNHLYEGNSLSNVHDSIDFGTFIGSNHNQFKTHCVRGHEFTEENIYYYENRRYCKTCMKLREDGEL